MQKWPNSPLRKQAILSSGHPANLPRIPVKTPAGTFYTILDSGASYNFIRTSIIDPRSQKTIYGEPTSVQLAKEGTELKIQARCQINLEIKDKKMNITFLVAEELSEDILLGHPWLIEQEVVTDYQRKCILFGQAQREQIYWISKEPKKTTTFDPTKVLHTFPSALQNDLFALLEQHQHAFDLYNPHNQTNCTQHQIRLKNYQPIRGPSYRYSPQKKGPLPHSSEPPRLLNISSSQPLCEKVIKAQESDTRIQRLVERMEASRKIPTEKRSRQEELCVRRFTTQNGALLYQDYPADPWKIGAPQNMRKEILQYFHEQPEVGHPGEKNTLLNLKRQYSWKGVAKDVRTYLKDVIKNSRSESTHVSKAGNTVTGTRPTPKSCSVSGTDETKPPGSRPAKSSSAKHYAAQKTGKQTKLRPCRPKMKYTKEPNERKGHTRCLMLQLGSMPDSAPSGRGLNSVQSHVGQHMYQLQEIANPEAEEIKAHRDQRQLRPSPTDLGNRNNFRKGSASDSANRSSAPAAPCLSLHELGFGQTDKRSLACSLAQSVHTLSAPAAPRSSLFPPQVSTPVAPHSSFTSPSHSPFHSPRGVMPKRTRRGTTGGKNKITKHQPTSNSPKPAPSSVNYTSSDNSLFPPPLIGSRCPRPEYAHNAQPHKRPQVPELTRPSTGTHCKRSTTHSGEDVPNEIGSTASLNNDLSENSVELTPAGEMFDAGQHWEMNYHEAAIFLEEGENNEKFDSHPHNSAALPAYLLVHNRWYYGLDMATSIILLTLAFVEEPALPLFKLPVAVHGSIELLALIIIGVELTMKLRWIGWRTILKHKRTMTKGITLGIMFVEAVTVLVRQSSHFRVTRALRPIFLVDTCHCGGVRRFIRQIFQSLPPILDMLGLLMFFISIYALLGYYLFSGEPRTEHFTTLPDSFVSMFVLLTTAKHLNSHLQLVEMWLTTWWASINVDKSASVLSIWMVKYENPAPLPLYGEKGPVSQSLKS
uniref:Uncharacterized protein n=1 Tax=Timema shepardi TaxID=629360 RepID=A0A7R9AV76_TIMSH|nr:unnamed protein product [Timema shepardi]